MDDQAPSVPNETSPSALELDAVMARDFVSLNMSSELAFVTPKKACKQQAANPQFSSSEVCAVCLSPLLHRKQREDNDYEVATTKCEHHFHSKCLQAIKQCKCECPLCRAALSPAVGVSEAVTVKEAIVRAASRGREAVRLAMLRRSQQELQ